MYDKNNTDKPAITYHSKIKRTFNTLLSYYSELD